MDVLSWVREQGCPWSEDLTDDDVDCCLLAAKGGHLEVLRWLRAHACPWDEYTCAASGGHLEVLVWVREQAARGMRTSMTRTRTVAHSPRGAVT